MDWTHVELSRPAYPVYILVHHLAPMSHPTYAPGYCEQHSKHVFWDAYGFVDDSCVKIDVRIQFPGLKILII